MKKIKINSLFGCLVMAAFMFVLTASGLAWAVTDYDAPTISAFSLPPASISAHVPVTLTAADNVGVSGYCLTASSTQVNDSGRKTVYLTLNLYNLLTNTSQVGALDIPVTLPADVYPLKLAASQSNEDATNSLSATPNNAFAGASYVRSNNTLDIGIILLSGFGAGKVATVALNAPSNQSFQASDFIIGAITASYTDFSSVTDPRISVSLTENATQCPAWSDTLPAYYDFSGIPLAVPTSKTLYAFVKDAAGNVSAPAAGPATTVITLPDTQKPTVDSFTIPDTSLSSTISITAFTASDNVGVTGYCVVEANDDSLCNNIWSGTAPVSHTFTGLPEGNNDKTLYAFARDAAQNVSTARTANVKVTIDTTKPVLTVSALPSGSYTNNKSFSLSGTAIDATSGLQSVTINGVAVDVDPVSNSFGTSVTLGSSNNTVTVLATDKAGNVAKDERLIHYSNTLPTLTVTNPTDNSSTPNASIQVEGTVDTLWKSATIKVNSADPVDLPLANNSFSTSVSLTLGVNTLIVTLTDKADNVNSVKRTVTYDPNAPELSVTLPAEDITIHDGILNISATASSSISSIKTVTVTANGVTNDMHSGANNSYDYPLEFTEEKLYPVTITATNEAQNSTSVTRHILYSKGTITINGGLPYTTSVKINLDLDYYLPANAKPTQMQFFFNNKSWTKPEPFSAKKSILLPSGDGVKPVMVRFLDANGANLGIYSASITLDTKSPTGAIVINGGAPVTGSTEESGQAKVSLSLPAFDLNGVIDMNLVYDPAQDKGWESYKSSADIFLPAGNGVKKVTVQYRDAAGKVSSAYSDTITLTSNWNAPYAKAGNMTIASVKAADKSGYTTADSVILGVTPPEGVWSGMIFSNDNIKWSAPVAITATRKYTLPAGDGLKTVYVKFADKLKAPTNFSDLYSGSIILDTKAPTGSLLINDGAFVTNSKDVTLKFAAGDVNGVSEVVISVDGGKTWDTPKTYSPFKTVTLPDGDGTKKVSVKFIDAAGKVSPVYSDSIILDTTKPLGSFSINKGATSSTSTAVTLTLAFTSAVTMRLSLDNQATWGGWEPYVTSKNVMLPGTGDQVVYVQVRDFAGNPPVTQFQNIYVVPAQ